MKEDEMDGPCNTRGIDDKCIQNFSRKTCREKTAQKT
jgi:hypothetical protein